MPGGRTNWHQHAVGQILYVLSGVGRYQLEGEPVQEIKPGDTVAVVGAGPVGLASNAPGNPEVDRCLAWTGSPLAVGLVVKALAGISPRSSSSDAS